jgi:ABC-type antimicrobial peptide transport system permease subunit
LEHRVFIGGARESRRAYEVVGVVADFHYFDLRRAIEPMFYRPRYREHAWSGGVLCIRAKTDPKLVVSTVRRLARTIDAAVTVTEAPSMADNLDRALLQERSVATVGGFFGIVALALAALGVYGIVSEVVMTRIREIGIRLALGAESGKIVWLVIRQSLGMLIVGVALGVAATLASMKYIESLLYGVTPQDPGTIAAATLLLLAVAVLAVFVPARRAVNVAPMNSLKHQ